MAFWAAALLAASTMAPGSPVPGPEQIMALPAELRAQVQDEVDRGGTQSAEQRLNLLVDFVFGEQGLGLEYDGGATRTVAEVFDSRKANCLSFTLLFVALAREVGLEAYPQELDQVLALYQQDGLIYNSGHINVVVRTGWRRNIVDIDRSQMIVRHQPKLVSDERALAHYYNNRGTELMAAGELAAARAHFDAALALDRRYVSVWTNLGVLNLRSGHPQRAETAYLTALSLSPDHAPTLFNLVGLYDRTDDPDRSAEYRGRLHKVQRADPFYQFLLAVEMENRGDYEGAINHYRRAVRLQRGEHHFHFGLARAYLRAGDHRRAAQSLARAHALGDEESRSLYRAKLQQLRR